MPFSALDSHFMARALQLARRGLYTTHPNPRVGCVLVREGMIVGEGFHKRVGEPHAEVYALQQAGDRAQGATVYVTLEPCNHYGRTPPCTLGLINAKVAKVIVAMADPNPLVAGQGLAYLKSAGIEVAVGLMETEARALNLGFLNHMERQRPYVRVKLASSLDGRTAMRSGDSVWITGEAARRDVQFWRAQASAVLTGIGTVLADNPSLNVRLSADELGIQGVVRQPVRVILDSHLRIPLNAKLLSLMGDTIIFTASSNAEKIQTLQSQGIQVEQLPDTPLNLTEVMQRLLERGLHEIHVEAGATLSGALMQTGWVDELLLYIAPHLMGSDARALMQMPFTQMQQRVPLHVVDSRIVGEDWRLLMRPNPSFAIGNV